MRIVLAEHDGGSTQLAARLHWRPDNGPAAGGTAPSADTAARADADTRASRGATATRFGAPEAAVDETKSKLGGYKGCNG